MAKKTTGKALVKWEEEFANLAKETTKGIKVSEGKFISFSGGRMSFAGSQIPDDEIRCVIVGWTHHNTYYDPDVGYDAKNPQSPICYASGTDEDEMVPHDSAPSKQADGCVGCPFNEFGSAVDGKGRPMSGKACKNTFRLALIAESDLENLDEAEVVYASIPPKSLKNWANYLGKDLKRLARPHWSVITLMKRLPDDTSQFRVEFSCEQQIEDAELFGPLKELWEKTMEGIDFPYTVRDAPPPAARVAKGKQKFARR